MSGYARRFGNSLAFLLLIATRAASTASVQKIDQSLSDYTSLELKQQSSGFTAVIHDRAGAAPTNLDRLLSGFLSQSDQIIVLSKNPIPYDSAKAVAVIARIPSPKKSGSFCGAGHEDYLLFIEIEGHQLRLVDKALIQSCLHNISLESDNGSDDPDDAVKSGAFPVIAQFKAMSPPDYEVKELRARMEGRKIAIEQQPSH